MSAPSGVTARERWWLLAAFVAGIGLRLLLLTTSYGSSDAALVTMWAVVAEQRGIPGAYAFSRWINHPPLSLLMMAGTVKIGRAVPITIPDLFRGMQVLAEIATATMLLFVGKRFSRGAELSVLYLLTPVAMFVSGFHCNSDPTMSALIVGAVLASISGRHALSGAVLAVAISIKVVPLLIVPLFALAAGRRFFRFSGSFAASAVVLFLPALLTVPRLLLRNVFGYSGLPGEWGLPALLLLIERSTGASLGTIAKTYAAYGKWLVALTVVVLIAAAWMRKRGITPDQLVRGVPLLMLVLLFLAPGFGVQYLIWPLPLLPLLISRRTYLLVAGFAAAFLFYTYTTWSDGFPWWFADADKHFPGTTEYIVFGLVLWLILGITAIATVRRFVAGDPVPPSKPSVPAA